MILAITQTPVGVGHRALCFTQHCGRRWPGTAQINGNRQKNVSSFIWLKLGLEDAVRTRLVYNRLYVVEFLSNSGENESGPDASLEQPTVHTCVIM